jgi:hypothetical protein
VKAGRQALKTRDIRYALVWVQPTGEAEIRAAFQRMATVRGLKSEAKALADRYFLETLVRVHRAGEGEPCAGLKDEEVETGIAVAEDALKGGSAKNLSEGLTGTLQRQLEVSFRCVQSTKAYSPEDLERGRRHIASYVSYIHHMEGLHKAIGSADRGHDIPADGTVH